MCFPGHRGSYSEAELEYVLFVCGVCHNDGKSNLYC